MFSCFQIRLKWFPSDALFSIFGSVMSGFGIKISAVFFLILKLLLAFLSVGKQMLTANIIIYIIYETSW